MPLPLIAFALGALAATKKPKKVKAVSGYTNSKGTKVKAYTKKSK